MSPNPRTIRASRPFALLAVFLFFASGFTQAGRPDPGPLVTDRPDATESADTVPAGFVQIESGLAFSRFDLDGEELERTAFPLTLVRIGLDPRMELRVDWAGMISEDRQPNLGGNDVSGAGNLALGAKIRLRDEKGAAPKLALLVSAALPTGDEDLRPERIDPRALVLGAHTLTDRIGLGWNLGVTTETVDDGGDFDTYTVGNYTASLGFAVSERWAAFVELFGAVPIRSPEAPANSLDAGVTHRLSNRLQLDFSGGVGLNDHADDWFLGTGVSVRLPR